MLIAVVTEVADENGDTNGTSLVEAHELVLAQLRADYPGNEIEYVFCEAWAENSWDMFTRITVAADGTQHGLMLMTNRFISRINARTIYRPYREARSAV
ncbi:hypothetical protein ACIA49_38595 [Kribbella sp. NPDC051587]|uniref:hypothetical protein n=1 Tax=Kribbella sp. NPDC051587 TaxID=3364119 RepID=UPI0037B553DD